MKWLGLSIITCVISAAFLAYAGNPDWYYFLIAAVVIAIW